jgi:polar amino acid transport system permease protein
MTGSVASPDASFNAQPPPGASGTAVRQRETVKAIPVRRWGQWLSAVVVLGIVAALTYSIARNDNIQWSVIGQYLFDNTVLQGLFVTVWLTIASMVLGIVLGIVVAVMRLSHNRVLSTVSWFYIWLFRGTPVLVQLLVWFNLALFFPRIGFGPLSAETNTLIKPLIAALLALALNEAAYMAEVVRGGILSVDHGQYEAAAALGMSRGRTMRRIVLPQAMRVIIPPTGNETITMLKTTSLVLVVGAGDLLSRTSAIGARNFTVIEMLLVASFWYVVLTSVASHGQYHLERRFARGTARSLPPTVMQRILANLRPGRVSGDAR